MTDGFFYQPHVHTADGVLSPDLLLDRLTLTRDGGANLPLTIGLLTSGTSIQQIGATACGNAALALVSAGRGTVATVASAHWDPALADGPAWLPYQVAPKPLSREAVRLEMLAGDPSAFVLRTIGLTGDDRIQLGETALDALPGFADAAALWSGPDAPEHSVLLLPAGHIDPAPEERDGYLVELAGKPEDHARGQTGGRTAGLTYSVERLTA